MSLRKICKNNRVKITTGKDRGKIGVVKQVDYPLYYVEGLNLQSKCVKYVLPVSTTAGATSKLCM